MRSALVFVFLLAFHPVAHAQKLLLAAGEPNSRKIQSPFGIASDAAGNLYIAEAFGHRVLKLDAKGSLTAIAGNGKKGDGGDGGPALEGQFNFMHDLIVARNGDVYVADSDNYRVRKIDAKTGILSTVAGVGKKDLSGDGGLANKAGLDGVASIFFDPGEKKLYVGGFTKRVRVIDMETGIIDTVKGLAGGRSLAVDSKGNLYVAGGQTLRVRRPDGAIETLLDAKNTGGAEHPLSSNPKHLAIDAQDNILIAEDLTHRIRKYVVAEKKLVDVAGTGKKGAGGLGGPPAGAELASPHGVFFHRPTGVIYIGDTLNDRVVKIEP